jgi:hypothetical protein
MTTTASVLETTLHGWLVITSLSGCEVTGQTDDQAHIQMTSAAPLPQAWKFTKKQEIRTVREPEKEMLEMAV